MIEQLTETMRFENDAHAAEYWLQGSKSKQVQGVIQNMFTLDKIDAVRSFREGRADLLVYRNGTYKAFQLREAQQLFREEVRALTLRLHKDLLNSSIA